ncbi:sigma-70 family RNA polymerase sigma factor [Caproiciproducens sp.]|uniref:sigma-70 family RNA polymerase sigma factor n=1 Tax=Caproiciproducens sp. TaxID=1954376 RepID=UPI0028994439|nr:sigma-70 family RNA polymerase sigma factor [Caproiciproducens sp.]
MRRKRNLSLDLFGDRLDVGSGGNDDGGEHDRMRRALRRAMEGELTERQRDCIRLRYFEQKSVQEVAEAMGITPPTVSKHLKKARARLHKVMGYSFSRLN